MLGVFQTLINYSINDTKLPHRVFNAYAVTFNSLHMNSNDRRVQVRLSSRLIIGQQHTLKNK
jgi:hypothetical protein